MTLRYKLGLTGTKLGCDRAECGACTVLVDDVPRYSCSVLTHSVRGQEDRDDRRAGGGRRDAASGAAGRGGRAGLPVRVLHAGVRDGDGRVSEDERRIRRAQELAHGISGNLCRCQDYDKILTAMMRGAELHAERLITWPTKLVGQNYTTPDLVAKVTGKAKYAEDFRAEGMLFAKLLLSPMPHARVVQHRHERGAGDARREGDPHGRRSSRRRRRAQTPRRGRRRRRAQGERPLTNEPVYEGEPILAVAAVDESPRPKRSSGSGSNSSRCRSSSIRW